MSDSSGLPPEKPSSLFRRLAHLVRGDSLNNEVREQIEEVIAQNERSLPAAERVMLSNLLAFGELSVRDVMVPRADIVAADEATALDAMVAIFRSAQHSRLPVYRETLDDPTGLVHIKDLLGLLQVRADGTYSWRETSIASIKRRPLFVPPSMPLLDLLLKMQTAHTHLALVIDEYGGTDGLVSIEDIIEKIVGDIADEHDVDEPRATKVDGGAYVADGRIGLDDFLRETGIRLAGEEGSEEVDTLGGLAVSVLGRMPQRGEIVRLPSGYEFEVMEADPRRVRRLRIRPPVRKPPPPAGTQA
jgi:CBS domain containing-hemolysin-like protein